MDHVIAVGDIFGMVEARAELHTLLARLEAVATAAPGCRRYTFAATIADPDHVIVVSEWESLDALQHYHESEPFLTFQLDLHNLLVRSSDLTVHAVSGSLRPVRTLADGPPRRGLAVAGRPRRPPVA